MVFLRLNYFTLMFGDKQKGAAHFRKSVSEIDPAIRPFQSLPLSSLDNLYSSHKVFMPAAKHYALAFFFSTVFSATVALGLEPIRSYTISSDLNSFPSGSVTNIS